jgi:two-component system cell cycle response regulator
LPTIAMKILELAKKDDSDIAEIAKLITKDAALSSKILRTVNSSFYGRSQKVSTISHAMVILGLQSVKTLVLGFSLVNSLSKPKGKSGFKHVDYWKRSIYAATAARMIAAKRSELQGEECFLAGLLMDIGMLVLDQTLGEQYAALVERATTHEELAPIEDKALQMNHAEVAGLLAEHWKLPPVLSIPLALHHNADAADDALRPLTRVIHLAGHCADVFVDAKPAGAIKLVREICKATYEMSEADCDLLLDEISRRTAEAAPLFEITIPKENYDSILKRASEHLVEITLSTQRQVGALKATASTLQVQNEQLKVQAVTDGLTRLANRAAFDRFFNRQFALARHNNATLALVLVDLDRFKVINDTHGHPAGDAVLRSVAKSVAAHAGRGNLACRYGGEELVIVMPGASRAQAATLAENLRKAIADHPVAYHNAAIAVTASVGVALYEPGSPFREPAHLLKAADLSLYAAKGAGRNCVKVFSLKAAA